MFTADGSEVLSLAGLEKNDLIYVSCGENWSDPSTSQAEQQKRILLANLASDVMKIKKYIALRECSGTYFFFVFVYSVECKSFYPIA